MKLDEEQLYRDDLEARRRERDREREPARFPRRRRDLSGRDALYVGLAESSVPAACPRCDGPVSEAGECAVCTAIEPVGERGMPAG
jgi:hypothetical protein